MSKFNGQDIHRNGRSDNLSDSTENGHANSLRFAFFVGCTVAYKLPHIEAATRFVMDALDIRAVDLPFSCCPDPNGVHSYSSELWYTLAARNLALADARNLDVVTLCNGCYATLNYCRESLTGDSQLRKHINQRLGSVGHEFSGEGRVRHFYQVLYEQIGYDRLRQFVVTPLSDLKIAVHYGCHSLRPKQMNPPENAENPQWLWQFADQVLGAETVRYLDESQCCGAGLREMDQDTALSLTRRKVRQMEQLGSNAILVPCPSCYLQFDAGQRLLKRSDNKDFSGIPVYYQTELLAIAMGAEPETIGLQYHMIQPDFELLQSNKAIPATIAPN
jgi:heterodisulfide reductase subunit B